VSKSSQTLQDLAWAFRVQSNGAAEVRTARRMGLTLREVAEARAAKCPDGWGDPPTAAELERAAAEKAAQDAATAKAQADLDAMHREIDEQHKAFERQQDDAHAAACASNPSGAFCQYGGRR
jgi:hypothetical protein